MVLVEKCFCCTLPIACGFFAAFLLIAYLIAFAFELIWIILETSQALPAAAVLLSAGYFIISLFAALLLHGLATKNTFCLVTWMFAVTILTFPEAGLVIYMGVNHWGTAHIYGITELSCWLMRIVVNVIEIILIQSLYVQWKNDDLMLKKRMEDYYYNAQQNNAFEDQIDSGLYNKRCVSMPHLWTPQQIFASEFNASVFMPPQDGVQKSRSLMDLRFLDQNDEFLTRSSQSEINYSTSSRRKSMDEETSSGQVIKHRTGFYARPLENYGVPIYYGPLDGPDFLIYKKQLERLNSRTSLSNTSADEISKYRDVALNQDK